MGREAERIAKQLDRVFSGKAWHGTSVFDTLDRIPAAVAADRPVDRTHSIIEIVLHMDAWISIVRRRAEGEQISQVDVATDWPAPSGADAAAWDGVRSVLRMSYAALGLVIRGLDDSALEEIVAGKLRSYTVYEDLHGLIQHTVYHLGQIVILAKPGLAGSGRREQ